ncbi:hypothetical protein ACQKOF_03330 [Lysinibacillus sp. NPDC093190]|uniref:hypothetical protein n=1 Tax=Lysinibacillus sp. NPDC093190 TaxID=3390575 RepID=UPI003D01DD96
MQVTQYCTLRAAGFAVDNGADLNEVFLTAAAIPEGDEEAWMREWKAIADSIYERGKYSFEHGDKISAREAFLRASAYYRSAEFYRRIDPLNDPHFKGRYQSEQNGSDLYIEPGEARTVANAVFLLKAARTDSAPPTTD